jgi:hypothetical protein
LTQAHEPAHFNHDGEEFAAAAERVSSKSTCQALAFDVLYRERPRYFSPIAVNAST